MRKFALSVLTLSIFCLAATGSAFADADTTPPKVTKFHLTNKIFKLGTKNTALVASTKKKARKTPVGTKIKFNLDENAYITIGVYKALPGRVVDGGCVKETPENADQKSCVRPVLINTMTRIGHPGTNSVAFSGVLDSKKLKTGAYAFGLVAADVAGNSTTPVIRSFFIVKG